MNARPTTVRYKVVGLVFLLSLILYVDRAALSVLAPTIRRDLNLGPMAMGWIFSAFVWGYALFHVPTGWLADRMGPRRVLASIVILWSGFTALTAAAWNLPSMLAVRFLFGAAEAGATPNVSRCLARWIPETERARAQGIFFAGMSAGAALATPVVTLLLVRWGWRVAFVALGTIGATWAVAWYLWYRDRPQDHPGVNPAELRTISAPELDTRPPRIAWAQLLRNRNLRAILAMYFTYGYTGYIFITWFPSYLIEARHLSVMMTGILAALPPALGMIAKPLGGWWSDWATARYGVRFGRRLVGMCGFGLGALVVIPGLLVPNPYVATLLLALADAGAALAHGVCFAVCLDVGLKRAGTVSALMLTAGSLGNAVSALAFGGFLQLTGSWTPPFLIGMLANASGALLWLKIDPAEKVV
jgi:MFS family permease